MKKEVIGNATLYLGDCMDLMKQFPDKHFDLAIVDPPYGGGNHKQSNSCKVLHRFGVRFDKYRKWYSKYGNDIDAWDIAPLPEYFNELFRVSNYQIIWGGNYFGLPRNRNFIIWRKKSISENFSMAMAMRIRMDKH
jgi:site-specific DNA-methyltransferase (adenine-specific)